MLPPTNLTPPFNVTRASHLVLTSRDLAKARDFYTEVVGLKVSHETATMIHFRGAEECGHHSLTLRATKRQAECECLGFRMFDEEELERASVHFAGRGVPARFVNVPFQGRTLRVTDPAGTPIEFCARMKALGRSPERTHEQRGAGAQRLNHFQVLVPDASVAAAFYCDIGFRVSTYFCAEERIVGLQLHRKGDPHDLVLKEGEGAQLHWVGYVVQETYHLIRAIDAAAHLGFAQAVEHGPVRQAHSCRLYLRDPDGHRLALLLPPIQMIDVDDGRIRHDLEDVTEGLSPSLAQHVTPFAEVMGAASPHDRAPSKRGFQEVGTRYMANGIVPARPSRLPELAR